MPLFILLIFSIGQIAYSTRFQTESKTKTKSTIKVNLHSLGQTSRLHMGPVRKIDLPKDASVYWEGWVKFFRYENGTHYDAPKAFFQNDEYFHQRMLKPLRKLKDKLGKLSIPDRASFYMVIYNHTISFYTSRQRILMLAFDNLNLDFIRMIPEDKPLGGGIKDLGDFDEGMCLEIIAKVPAFELKEYTPFYKGKDQTWVICTDKRIDKKRIFKTLVLLKLRRQRRFGHIATNEHLKNLYKNRRESIDTLLKKNTSKRGELRVKTPRDGYWMLLNNWTKCTLSCGGGKSYQQWLCVPPKDGGKAMPR